MFNETSLAHSIKQDEKSSVQRVRKFCHYMYINRIFVFNSSIYFTKGVLLQGFVVFNRINNWTLWAPIVFPWKTWMLKFPSTGPSFSRDPMLIQMETNSTCALERGVQTPCLCLCIRSCV